MLELDVWLFGLQPIGWLRFRFGLVGLSCKYVQNNNLGTASKNHCLATEFIGSALFLFCVSTFTFYLSTVNSIYGNNLSATSCNCWLLHIPIFLLHLLWFVSNKHPYFVARHMQQILHDNLKQITQLLLHDKCTKFVLQQSFCSFNLFKVKFICSVFTM